MVRNGYSGKMTVLNQSLVAFRLHIYEIFAKPNTISGSQKINEYNISLSANVNFFIQIRTKR